MNQTADTNRSAEEIFWRAAEKGVLMLPRCIDTGKCFFYPRDHSPFTGGAIDWVRSAGRGEIYSCSINYRADVPYCIAYIRLDEGPIMLSNIVARDLNGIDIGQRVEVCFLTDEHGRAIPFFKLEEDNDHG